MGAPRESARRNRDYLHSIEEAMWAHKFVSA